MEVRASKVPEDVYYITEGKIYNVSPYNVNEFGRKIFNLTDDDGDVIPCDIENCADLNGGDWEIVNE